MQHGTSSSAASVDYGIDVHSRHRAISADVAQFLITGCDDRATVHDREVPCGVARDVSSGVRGTWEATAMTSRESSAVTMSLTASGRDVAGSVHFGPPAFDVTLPLVGRMLTPQRLSATIGTGDGVVTFAATLDADGLALEGPVVYAGRVLYTLRVVRR
jgi:hypothetical protein